MRMRHSSTYNIKRTKYRGRSSQSDAVKMHCQRAPESYTILVFHGTPLSGLCTVATITYREQLVGKFLVNFSKVLLSSFINACSLLSLNFRFIGIRVNIDWPNAVSARMEEEAMTKAGDKAYRATPSSHHLTHHLHLFFLFIYHVSSEPLFNPVDCCNRNLRIGVAPPLTQYDASDLRIRCSLYHLRTTAVSPRRFH